MQRVKIFVFLVFTLFSLAFYGYQRQFAPMVSGQSSGATLPAPNGVDASDAQYADKIRVSWETVRGANLYRIYRSATNNQASATDAGTTAANYFFDTPPVQNQNYFYWVKAENGSAASILSQPDTGLRANGTVPTTGFFVPLNPPNAPADNQISATKAYLGKTLFWDEQLSSTNTVACGTCHRPSNGGSDPRTTVISVRSLNPGYDNTFDTNDDVSGSPGVPLNNLDGTYSLSSTYGFNEQVTPRKAPSYLNAAYSTNGLFWDGRATDTFRDPITNAVVLPSLASLESQVLGPPVSAGEMAHGNRNWTQAAAQIASVKPLALATNVPHSLANWINGRTYPQLFEEAFGTPDVTPSRIAMAIATHERTLFTDQTPLDKWASQIQPLTTSEENGRALFVELHCNSCHDGTLLSDQNFHNIALRPVEEDLGRAVVTGNPDDNGTFKTPTLRNVALHAPYMHNGRFATLEAVVSFYNRGGDFDAPSVDHGQIHELGLNVQQQDDLVAFLKRPLTDPRVENELPPFDHPKLYTETTRVPQIMGTGRAGSGAFVPKVTAIEPPFVGNPSFTVGVSTALGNNQQAVLVIDANDPGVAASIPATGSFVRQTVTVSGTGSGKGYASVSLAIPNDPDLIGRTFYGRWYVTDAGAANGFSVSQAFKFTIFAQATTVGKTSVDFDGDRKTDISIFRPNGGEWWYLRSQDNQNRAFQFGASTDKLVPADYTGDGKTDVAVWRPSTGEWFIMRSEDNSFYSFPFGASGDVPVPADFDADGKADPTVFRPSTATWYTSKSTGGSLIQSFGIPGDIPQVGDYDADGKADLAIYRPNAANGAEWWINRTTLGAFATQFGLSTDKPVAADYTGDGKTDVAFWRPTTGQWFILRSEDFTYYAAPFGANGDIPAPGDYDGDGKSDFAVFRPSTSTWYANRSGGGAAIIQAFGIPGDYPMPAAYVP
jgi:cytochrome c peroxidase